VVLELTWPVTHHGVPLLATPASSRDSLDRYVLPRYVRAPVAAGLTVLAADWVLKALAARLLYPRVVPYQVIVGVLALEYVANPGALFGLGAGAGWLAPWLPLAQAGVLLPLARLWRRTRADDAPTLLLIALTAAGVLGNLLDRVRDGYVVDYVVLTVGGAHLAGNLADLAIAAGVFGLARVLRRGSLPSEPAVALSRLRAGRR
jgi:signal peptidase II